MANKKKNNVKIERKGITWQVDDKKMKVSMVNGNDTKVKVTFQGDMFTPDEFTSLYMALLESYTESLLEKNERKDIYEHWNRVFGIFLNKILTDKEIYETSSKHKEFKEVVENTLGAPETEDIKSENEDLKFAAMLLARDIMIEAGLTEDTVDALLNKKLGLVAPTLGGEENVQ